MYEVTVAEYEAFVAATGHPVAESCMLPKLDGTFEWQWTPRTFRTPSYPITARHPVTCISRDDAAAYAARIASVTGRPYRLPLEREWEHAVRAGSVANFNFGDDVNELCDHGRFAHAGTPIGRLRNVSVGCKDHDEHGPLPVGSLKPNRWHLHDMHGNVWEWVADCAPLPSLDAFNQASAAPGSESEAGSCPNGMIRGGGYNSRPLQLRSSSYEIEPRPQRGRSDSKGFRIALTLED